MSTPSESDLLGLAVPYALDALDADERAAVDQRLARAPEDIAVEFGAQVAEVRETMARLAAGTAARPSAALRRRVLRDVAREPRWRGVVLAGAAAVAIGLAAFGAGWVMHPPSEPPVAERVLTAPDVRAMTTSMRTGGTATVVYSRLRGDGVLLFSNVTAPPEGMRYQVWLMKDDVPVAAGDAAGDVRTVMLSDIGGASALGVTMGPMGGAAPGEMVARVQLP
jgi:anti-sigma-K factor RskA